MVIGIELKTKFINMLKAPSNSREGFKIICPFCFMIYSPNKVVFRAMHSQKWDEEYSLKCDELLNQYRSRLKLKEISEIEVVIDPEEIYPENRKYINNVLLEIKDKYGVSSKKRLCPYCHNELPSNMGKGPSNIISIIGSPKVGKSTYMTVLLELLQNKTAKNFGAKCYAGSSRYRALLKAYEDKLYKNGEFLDSDIGEDSMDHLVLTFDFDLNDTPPITFVFYDVSSESMINQSHLELYEANIKNSRGIIFLVDPMQLEKIREERVNSGVEVATRFYKPRDIIVRLYENFISTEKGDSTSIPTAIVLTKIDCLINKWLSAESEAFNKYFHKEIYNLKKHDAINKEIRKLIKKNDKAFLDVVELYFKNTAFFGVSALNSEESYKDKKAVIDPSRVDEPLIWIMHKLGYIKGGRE